MTTETETPAAQTPVNWSAAPVRTLGSADIEKAIPHRFPFLLVDTVDILQEKKLAIGTKGTTMNEHFFQGHFPGHPIMPGVLIIEALAQTACVLMMAGGGFEGKIAYFLGITEAKFRAPVTPGNLLKLHVEILRLGGRAGKARGEAYVNGNLCTEVEMSFALAPKQ